MKKVLFVLFCMAIVLSWSFSAYAERKFSFELPAGAVIPSNASVTITKYEKVLLLYGECSGGEAAYVMALSAFGVNLTQDDIHKASGLKKVRGCYADELYYAAMNLGIDMEGYFPSMKSKKERLSHLNDLKYFISLGYPVVISWDEDPKKVIDDFCSFAVVVSYNDEKQEITVVDPYVGTISGRTFTYKEFLDHWQYDYSDGSYECFMDVIKGKLKAPKDRLKTATFHITEGQTVELAYNEITTDAAYFIVSFEENVLIVSEDILGMDRAKLNGWIINDMDKPNFWIYGGGAFFFKFTSIKGQGDISITYEPKDGDLFLKQ
jgi:hypothetical protein